MPEKTKEGKELKEKKETISKKTTKSSSKVSSSKNNNNSKKKTASSKKVSPKVSDSKTTTKTKRAANTSKKTTQTTSKRTVKADTKKDNNKKTKSSVKKIDVKTKKDIKTKIDVVKEETIIEKIKSFLAKIIAMQEEAKLEIDINNKSKDIVDEKKIDNKKSQKQESTSYMLEYYDLPYRYNETVVKILAQTPKKLFVYWDISDNDRVKYLKVFGEKFFEDTYPVLLVHNQEKNYTFEVTINDFANSWYIDINDAKSTYIIELGRKFKSKSEIVNIAKSEEKDIVLHNDYVPITVSNVLEVPNDCVLFENLPSKILYRNVKNNQENFIDIENIGFIKDMEHIYNITDFYKEFYKDELEEKNMLHLLNPSSMSSSTVK